MKDSEVERTSSSRRRNGTFSLKQKGSEMCQEDEMDREMIEEEEQEMQRGRIQTERHKLEIKWRES